MRRLKEDSINLWRGVARAPRPRARLALPALLLLSLALMVLSRLDHPLIRATRTQLGGALAPVLSAVMAPVAPLREAGRGIGALIAESDRLERLEASNRELEGWRWKAEQVARELADLKRQTGTVVGAEPTSLTTRVIADASGIFVRSALLDAGRDHGIRIGHPVVTVDGLVGRIVDAGRRTSSVLLLTDVNSRVPIVVGHDAIRAVMAGDNGARPHLEFVGPGDIGEGQTVTTSGAGGLFPPGLRVGRVVRDGPALHVAPAASLDALGYVRVLLYDSDALHLADERFAAPPPPPPRETGTLAQPTQVPPSATGSSTNVRAPPTRPTVPPRGAGGRRADVAR